MDEYFDWVNIDKKQYICPGDFGQGNYRFDSSCRGNVVLLGVRDLLANEWQGCKVLFMGDEKDIPEGAENSALKQLYDQTVQNGTPGKGYDTQVATYWNISGFFAAAEVRVRREIIKYLEALDGDAPKPVNEYGVDVSDPYGGLFLREGMEFRITLNHTKKVGYSPERTAVFLNGEAHPDMDPLPLLMAYGRTIQDGLWLGDIIGVSDELPEGYTEITEFHFDCQNC